MSGHSHASEYGSHGHGSHGHVIVPLFTLRTILLALLFFTLLTVGLSKAEEWLAVTFDFGIPQWVNVVVALSIAVVKTALVVLFFMQLKYDSPLNGMIFIFTLLTVASFLGFTMIDLGGRTTIDRFKGEYIVPGGTGLPATESSAGFSGPIVMYARDKAELEGHAHHDAGEHAGHRERGLFTDAGYRDPVPAIGSSSEISRPVRGLTLPGFAASGATEADEAHDDAHGAEPAAEPPKPAPASTPGH
jgi:cytochrome c oxidase subunit 4